MLGLEFQQIFQNSCEHGDSGIRIIEIHKNSCQVSWKFLEMIISEIEAFIVKFINSFASLVRTWKRGRVTACSISTNSSISWPPRWARRIQRSRSRRRFSCSRGLPARSLLKISRRPADASLFVAAWIAKQPTSPRYFCTVFYIAVCNGFSW